MLTRSHTSIIAAAALLAALTSGPEALASGLEKGLEAQLRGAWCVLSTEVYSGCGGSYTDNRVLGAGVASKSGQRFAPGELARIDKVKVKRTRIDLLLSLAEPILVSRFDGPFELFDEHRCQVQLIFDIPRATIKAGDADAVLGRVGDALATYTSLVDAQASEAWSGRARDPYPPDYQLTLARHAVWKAEQINVAIRDTVDEALEDAARRVDHVNRNPHYLDGFAAGAARMREWSERDCDDLLGARFGGHEERAPVERRGDAAEARSWRDGFRDGQALVFDLLIARRLGECFVPVPILPPGR